MKANDVLQIGPFKYTVLKRDGNRALIQWIESTGIEKTLWLIVKKTFVSIK